MGTFHDDKGQFHGITVAVRMKSGKLYVGRCDTVNEQGVFMIDVDEHVDGEHEKSREEYLKQAIKWGIFPKHKHLVLDVNEVDQLSPLNEIQI